jgi:hypothetical protein
LKGTLLTEEEKWDKTRQEMLQAPSAAAVEYAMSTSQHSQRSVVPGIVRPEEPEPSGHGYEPTIGLKAVARILDCSAEQCRRLAEAKKIPVFRIGYRWKSTASAIVRWREEQLALIRHSRPSEER